MSKGEFVCSTCSKSCKSAHGYTNLITHLRFNHPTYLEDASQALKNRNALRLRVVDDETRNIFRWWEWVVMDRLPLAFVERSMTRKNSSLSAISKQTLKSYLMRVYQSAEARVAEELPPLFGVVLDGSTFNDRHYIAIFAVFDDPTMCHGTHPEGSSEYYDDTDCFTRRVLLLDFCPLDVEEDLGAQSLIDLIAGTLSWYNKPWEAVNFMVADNCSVNQYIGNREGAIPMVGCASHRFNLAVAGFLADHETLLAEIQALMTKLRTIKGRVILRRATDLAPLLRNDTRWSSTSAMVQRYAKLEPVLNSLGHGTLVEFGILRVLDDFEGVPTTLQRSSLTLFGARCLFDHVIQRYPKLKPHLSASAAIVNNVALETGIVKLERKETLTPHERAACIDFRRVDESSALQVTSSDQPIVQQALKKRKVTKRSKFVDVAFIPPTSNECKRFFLSVKLVYSDLRKRLDASTLEMLMFLLYNKNMWDVYTVEALRS